MPLSRPLGASGRMCERKFGLYLEVELLFKVEGVGLVAHKKRIGISLLSFR